MVSGNSESGSNGSDGVLIEASTNHLHREHDVDDSDARKMQRAADHTGALDRSGPAHLRPFFKIALGRINPGNNAIVCVPRLF